MHFNKGLTTIAAVATILLSGQVAAVDQMQPPAVSASSALDSIIEQRMNEAGIVGLGAAIILNKKIVWMRGYGFADKGHAIPFTPNTIMNIGSISKTFTGAALMRAVQEGKLYGGDSPEPLGEFLKSYFASNGKYRRWESVVPSSMPSGGMP